MSANLNISCVIKKGIFSEFTSEHHQSSNFDTFKCSGENLPNFSCRFSNHSSVFLQNLHNTSVS